MSARPVMCAIEDSEASRHAVRAATWLAQGLEAALVLAHAFDPMGIGTLPRRDMLARGITDDELEHAAPRHLGDLSPVAGIQRRQPTTPPQSLRMPRTGALALGLPGPDRVQFAVLAEQMPVAQQPHIDVPDPPSAAAPPGEIGRPVTAS